MYSVDDFPSNLKKYREGRGIRQRDLSEEIGYAENYISVFESGLRVPSSSFVRSVAYALEIPVGCLFSDYEPMRYDCPEIHSYLKSLSLEELKHIATVLEAVATAKD